ncbi:hypothetical protein BDZ94DRAFT_1248095 [Collybia nuda]|uniref:Uncharacterized protein n=1 Tax=Collybia nuda TaxID=64659 RepID=A0A9P5YG35_9AGAR|nr:hypothetical protein BDZ94DRAFT_1248095 [Collybia nuda]
MAVLLPRYTPMNPAKRSRRNATAVMAGVFDVRPARDVLTSLLNGVGPYKAVEKDEQAKRIRKREKKEKERERKAALKAQRALAEEAALTAPRGTSSGPSTSAPVQPIPIPNTTSSFWKARPAIQIATGQRSVSITPPPVTSPMLLPSTPASTPGPSNSSSTSRTSSKRPHTPDDYDDLDLGQHSMPPTSPPQPRRKRVAVKKGWKGWVEGSPPPSEKLINLDAVPVLQERRTRSGKNFDAIGVGKEGWV